ncbi:MAG: FAD-dependent oxidoreductase [Syntrophorhabdaceae bacterium]|nr:FAD-dependent oxidoreductase [Syntrophorhabdaceae bacterium]MDD4196716.1 FAD-dependent oxidoreductase [Syntrophorhabdaceae bacterium]HOC45413.1 FAD-dependent oxidoreductase [Syntrophorhabdaceae bacterium]
MNDRKRIVVIGGSAAGPKAAARARRMDEEAQITIIQKDPDLSMASCGYPYYVGGVFDDRNMLLATPTGVTRDPKFYISAKGIVAKTQTEATRIDRQGKTVMCRNLVTNETEVIGYDKLVLATGSTPRYPPVPGVELSGITTLQSMRDADYLRHVRDERKIRKAVIIGGGLIGMETSEALELAGIEITIIELLPQLLTFLDWEMAKIVENHVKSRNANVITQNGLAAFLGEGGKLTGVKLSNGTELPCELAVVAIGINPNTRLARDAGITIGETGGIAVDQYMQTSDPDIYAVGDCIEVTNLITGKKVLAPYGDLANLEGRVAGENAAAGNHAIFPGTIQTGICKVFDYTAGSTGLSEKAARGAGFTDIETVINASPDKPGFMQGKMLVSKLVVERTSGRILGAQCVGMGDVSKQIAQWAMTIKGSLTIDDMINADLPYAPPFSLAIDHGIASAHIIQNKIRGFMKGISCADVKKKIENREKVFFLDARGPDEYEQMRLGIGETLIPIGMLRKRLNELPQDKGAEIICYCKISLRGYEAARVLEANGWRNVKVMEGGLMAWPFHREK